MAEDKTSDSQLVSQNRSELVEKKDEDCIVVKTHSGVETVSLDGLTEEQKQELKMRYANVSIDNQDKMNKLTADVNALGATLNVMGKTTQDVADAGQSITITNTKEDELGRTEVIMGTSDAAKSGKLSRSAKGLKDNTTLWLGVIVLIVGIVALVIVKTQ